MSDVFILPASSVQRRLWFLEQWETGEPVYNTPVAYGLTGCLDYTALETALDELVTRHEVLRTTFASENGDVVQRVRSEAQLPLALVDLEAAPDVERQLECLLREEARRPFDLERGPLVRATLYRLTKQDHVLCIVVHHIVFDGWSEGVLMDDLQQMYTAVRDGRLGALPELSIQYGDYAAWQNERVSTELERSQLDYWKQQLDGVAALELPTDRPRPKLQSYRGAELPVALPSSVVVALKRLAREEKATLYMTLVAAFRALLHRYTAQSDIAIGFLVSGRDRSELEGMIGCFVNTLALRVDSSADPTFRELIGRTRDAALSAYANQDVPFDRVVDAITKRDLSRSPLFQVLFNQAPSHERHCFADLTARRIRVDVGIAKFDLSITLAIGDTRDDLDGWLEFNTDLFDRSTIDRMFGHFQLLLAGASASPDCHISALPLLSEAERDQQLAWNGTDSPITESRLEVLVSRQAARVPEHVAVAFDDQTMSYRELEARAAQLAERLRTSGVAPGMRVALCMERSIEMVVALLAIMKTGAAYVPLDPAFPAVRLAMMVEDSRAALVLTHRAAASLVPSTEVPVLSVDDAATVRVPNDERDGARAGADLAYVIYTSGSTGTPKGVAVTHRALVNILESMAKEPGFDERDVMLSVTTLSFDIAALELFLPLITGGRVTLVSREETIDGPRLVQRLQSSGATVMQATPATWHLLLQAGWTGDARLKALCGGESLPRDLAEKLLDRTGELWNVYGPTETTIWSSACRVHNDEVISVGHPIANTQLWVLDNRRQPVPVGVVGELYIGGAGVSPGYWLRDELTSERFIPDPFSTSTGARLFRTGDLARRLADGTLVCLGRIDHQVKLRGFRIELGEIETVLARAPGVRAAAVALRDDQAGDPRLIAYVVATQPSSQVAEALRAKLRATLPAYMVPSDIVFLDALPLTPNGKLDRRSLPVPKGGPPRRTESPAPRTATEAMVVACFGEVLGRGDIGVFDDFFDLGGHSLIAARLIALLRSASGHAVPLRSLFEHPTPAGLAAVIDERFEVSASGGITVVSSRRDAIVPLQPEGSRTPVFAVAGHSGDPFTYRALARHLGADQPFFALQSPGLDGNSPPLTNIDDFAAHFTRAIVDAHAPGPVIIAGYCAGGSAALELALRLRERDFDVRLLALFGCPYPSVYRFMVARFYLRRAALHLKKAVSLPSRERWRYAASVTRTVTSMLRSPSRLRRIGPSPASDDLSQFRTQVEQATIAAARHYTPRAFPGRLALFYPNREWSRAGYQAARWSSLAERSEEYYGPEGCDQDTMLLEPWVGTFGHYFQDARDSSGPSTRDPFAASELRLAEQLQDEVALH